MQPYHGLNAHGSMEECSHCKELPGKVKCTQTDENQSIIACFLEDGDLVCPSHSLPVPSRTSWVSLCLSERQTTRIWLELEPSLLLLCLQAKGSFCMLSLWLIMTVIYLGTVFCKVQITSLQGGRGFGAEAVPFSVCGSPATQTDHCRYFQKVVLKQ